MRLARGRAPTVQTQDVENAPRAPGRCRRHDARTSRSCVLQSRKPLSASHFGGMVSRSHPGSSCAWRKEIADPAFIVFVAEADDFIIGFAMANPSKNELLAVYVKPNSIGNVGRALLAEVEKRAFAVADF